MSDIAIENRLEIIEKKLDQKAAKADIEKLYVELDKKADKEDIRLLKEQNQTIIGILEKQSQTLDIIRTEQKAISATLSLHEERIGDLEEKVFGHRIREDQENYGRSKT
jgi:hypothetical protein